MARRLEDVLGQGAKLAAELRARQDAAATRAARPEPPAVPPAGPVEPAPTAPRRPVGGELLEALQKLR